MGWTAKYLPFRALHPQKDILKVSDDNEAQEASGW